MPDLRKDRMNDLQYMTFLLEKILEHVVAMSVTLRHLALPGAGPPPAMPTIRGGKDGR